MEAEASSNRFKFLLNVSNWEKKYSKNNKNHYMISCTKSDSELPGEQLTLIEPFSISSFAIRLAIVCISVITKSKISN